MNAYVLSGWIVALAGTALYSGWTIITSRRIAAQVLAVKSAESESNRESELSRGSDSSRGSDGGAGNG